MKNLTSGKAASPTSGKAALPTSGKATSPINGKAASPTSGRAASVWNIFIAFAGVGAITFGGGYTMLPLLHKSICAKRGWATEEEINDCYSVSQCLPGIIAVNTAMQLGYKKKGAAGLLSAALGVITPSIIIILLIAMFIQQFMDIEWVRHAFNGIRAGVLALIADAAVRLWKNGVKDLPGIIIFVLALLSLLIFNVSPILPILAGAICGIVIKERKYRINKKDGICSTSQKN
jgi:chromate transporter